MKKSALLLLFTPLFFGCGEKEKSDKELLDIDQKALEASLHTEKVIAYKFCKIMLRSSADPEDQKNNQFQKEMKDNAAIFEKVRKGENLSPGEYAGMLADYQRMRSYVIKTDEDEFPVLKDLSENRKGKFLKGKAKLVQESKEHALLGGLVLLSRDLGTDVALYECSETDPSKLQDSELKSILLLYRGTIFLDKGFFYLSEKELTENIDWLEKHRNKDLSFTRSLLGWKNKSNDAVNRGFIAMNYLMRGSGRMMMERESDKKRSVEDLEKFLKEMNSLGISNELTWSVEVYVYLKKGERDKAIASLTKLSKSPAIGKADKKAINETITFLQEEEDSDNAIENAYDKLFIGKMATNYLFDRASEMDLADKVPYGRQLNTTLKSIDKVAGKIEKLANGETIKETGNDIKGEGGKLLDKTEGLFD